MSWETFCACNKVGSRYLNASFEDYTVMDTKIRQGGIDWVKKPHSLVLSGQTGRGKTHFMYALIRNLLKSCDISQIRLYKAKKLDDFLLHKFKEYGSASYFIDQLADIRALFIDDFGVERPTERTLREIYEIIDERHAHQKLTVLTTNLSNSQIKKVYGDRIHSRLKDYEWITFTGKDLRGNYE
tara:strand:- start:2888 stop:3439 length:552 start_codon:yes stop_codon:yes gene_type:complete